MRFGKKVVPINARVVMGPNAQKNRDGRIEFDSAFRKLMRTETEMYFEHLIREDRSILDLVDSLLINAPIMYLYLRYFITHS